MASFGASGHAHAAVGQGQGQAKHPANICKIIIQQCIKADLSFDTNDPPVSIDRGMIVSVCFLQEATEGLVEAIAKTILDTRLCEPVELDTPNGSAGGAGNSSPSRRISPLEFVQPSNGAPDDGSGRFDVLLVPQATLNGKLKGKSMQYHGLAGKDEGLLLFSKLVETIRQQLQERSPESRVHHGIYGARQILSMETNGPFTHIFEF